MLCMRRFPTATRLTASCLTASLFFWVHAPAMGQVEEGFQASTVPSAPPGAFTGGMDVLSNGNYAIFDGTDIVEVDSLNGNILRTIFTPPTFVFGSFVKVSPSGSEIYFGESSFGDIYRIDTGSGVGAPFVNLPFNFDMEFDPFGRAFVSAASGAFGENHVHFVDLIGATTDEILILSSFSGPLEFDAIGNLYIAQPDLDFPPDPGDATVFLLTKSQVDGAIGPGFLVEGDATPYALGLHTVSDMAFDDEGDLYTTDFVNLAIFEIKSGGSPISTIYSSPTVTPGAIRFSGGTKGVFGPFQPAKAGRLHSLISDFSTVNDLIQIDPLRPSLSTTPPSPIPPGAFTLDLAQGPASGLAFLVTTLSDVQPEYEIFLGGTPVCLGLDLASILLINSLPLGPGGDLTIPVFNPGVGNVTLYTQAIELRGGSVVGTTNPLTLTLQ